MKAQEKRDRSRLTSNEIEKKEEKENKREGESIASSEKREINYRDNECTITRRNEPRGTWIRFAPGACVLAGLLMYVFFPLHTTR
jgi:hypothetical protein